MPLWLLTPFPFDVPQRPELCAISKNISVLYKNYSFEQKQKIFFLNIFFYIFQADPYFILFCPLND